MGRTRSRIAFGIIAAASMALMGASGSCLPLKKQTDAVTPAIQVGGYDTVSQCPSFLGINAPAPGYQGEVEPIFQRVCVTCHVSGTGSAHYKLTAGDSQDNNVAAANFFVARDEAVPIGGSVDPNTPDSTSPLLERLNGGLTHDLTLDLGGSDYAAIRDWVTQELLETCVIDPSSGTVTVTGPSPTPTN